MKIFDCVRFFYYKYFFLNPYSRAEVMRKNKYFAKQGTGCYIAGDITITNPSLIELGDNVWITTKCALLNHDFGLPDYTIKIGSNVRLGYGTIILKNVVLAKGITTGAGTIVTKSFSKENCVIVGNPAKIMVKKNR